ncbi:unnamed protein product, partial [Brenthis ino]
MKRSRGQLMIHLVEKKCSKTKTLENFEDSPFPPRAELFTEEMSFINTVVNLNNPEDFFEETPTVKNLYRTLSNNSSDSDSSTTCFKDQEVCVIVHNTQERKCEPQLLSSHQNLITGLSVSKQEKLPEDDIESFTPILLPSVSFSSAYQQTKSEFNCFPLNSDYTDTPLSSPTNVKTKKQKKKDKGRLRERYQSRWLYEKRKYNLKRGLEYISRTGNITKQKEMKAPSKYPRKYSEKVEEMARFLVVGHIQNEGDSIHSVIEKKTRNVLIYTPDQWTLAFKMATANAKPYIVKEVTQSLIFDFKSCLSFFDNWKKNCIGELVMWNKICEVNVQAKDLFKLNYKYTLEKDAYKTIQW